MKIRDTSSSAVRDLLCVTIFFFSAGTAAFAQAGRGGISGLVSDPSGAVVPGAAVKVLNEATGSTQSTVTSGGGLYSVVSLAPGTYEVTASKGGFSTVMQSHVVVTVDQVTTLNLTLNVGKITEVVKVTGAENPVDTSTSTVGQLIDAAVIDRVPLVDRDVYQLVQLTAGVIPANGTPNSASSTAIFNARSLIDVSSYTINGALQGNVYYMVDGSPIGIAEHNTATLIPAFQVPEDAVEEYRVETQNAPATYQSASAGVISLATKSGSNKFHGDAFVYLRPNVLAANDYFLKLSQLESGQPNQPLDFHRYQEGGSFGGPILHDKLFFFVDYQGTQQESLQTAYYTFPTAAERLGDFTADSFTVYNPLLPDAVTGLRQPIFGANSGPNCASATLNCIPQADLNPIALKIASFYPLPNRAGVGPWHMNNYFASGLAPQNGQQFDVRLDYDQSEQNHVYGRFSFARLYYGAAYLWGSSNNINGVNWEPDLYRSTTPELNVLLADDYIVNQKSVLQIRYSFARQHEDQTDPRQAGVSLEQLGFPASLAAQVGYPTLPTMRFNNFTSGIGGGAPGGWYFLYASENSDGSLTYRTVFGKHELAVGLEYEKLFLNEGFPTSPAGAYTFDNTATSSTTFAGDGSDFASFLLGIGTIPGTESGFSKDVFTAESNPYYGAFIQDSYRLSKTLTANLGLRWDIFGGATERYNRLEFFDPTVQYSVNGVPLTGGLQYAGVGRSRSPFLTNLKDFSPRLGVAWQPAGHVVIRAGFGIYYGPSANMVSGPYFHSQGYSSLTIWNATTYNADGNTVMLNSLSNPFPAGLVQPTGNSLGPATGIGVGLTGVMHSQPEPRVYNYNLGFEYHFPQNVTLSAAYVGNQGRHLAYGYVDLDQLSLSTIGQYGIALNNLVPNTWEAVLPPTSAFYGQATVPQWLALEPYPQFTTGGINAGVGIYNYPLADSEYDSLQMKLEKRLTRHLSTLATYTWGKIMTNDAYPPLWYVGSHNYGPQDWKNLNLEHSVSPQDVSHQLTWHASYDLPIGNGRAWNLSGAANQVLGDWTVNAIVFLSSGIPVGSPNTYTDPYFNQRVNMNCDPGRGAQHTVQQWFTYACFSQPSSNFIAGTAPAFLSHVRMNGAHDLDLSVYKDFHLGEHRNLRFEVHSYNVTNSVQFGSPNVFWNPSPTPENMAGFGQITSDVNTPRQFQFAARFTF
jgi:hypothetical protein